MCDDQLYQQTIGVAMDSPFRSILANTFLCFMRGFDCQIVLIMHNRYADY